MLLQVFRVNLNLIKISKNLSKKFEIWNALPLYLRFKVSFLEIIDEFIFLFKLINYTCFANQVFIYY